MNYKGRAIKRQKRALVKSWMGEFIIPYIILITMILTITECMCMSIK